MLNGSGWPMAARFAPQVLLAGPLQIQSGPAHPVCMVEARRSDTVRWNSNWQAIPQFKIGNGCAPMSSQFEKIRESETRTIENNPASGDAEIHNSTINEQFAIFHWANGVFPLITPRQHAAFNDATARETHKTRMQIRECLHHIRAQAAGAIFQVFSGNSEMKSISSVPLLTKVTGQPRLSRRFPWDTASHCMFFQSLVKFFRSTK